MVYIVNVKEFMYINIKMYLISTYSVLLDGLFTVFIAMNSYNYS